MLGERSGVPSAAICSDIPNDIVEFFPGLFPPRILVSGWIGRGQCQENLAVHYSSMDKEGQMPRKIIGFVLTVGGGLIFTAAMVMGVVGIPRPGWGYYKMPMALIGIIVASAGILLLEWMGKNKNDAPMRGKRFFPYGRILNLTLSFFPRLPFINNISGWWRSSHTLLTSFWFQKEGIHLFNHQTPIFGPPWKVPLEFPLDQAISTLFSNITRLNLTLSSRLMSLAIFIYPPFFSCCFVWSLSRAGLFALSF
jgi:hypothetical protein